jgi:ABC-2 type transport system permease protein
LLNFLPLVQNENMKIYRRPRTWIMIGIVLAILILMVVIQKTSSPNVDEAKMDYKQKLEQRIQVTESHLNDPNFKQNDRDREYMQNQLMEYKYALEHELDITKNTLWNTVQASSGFIALMAIFTIVIAADIVAGEFSGGTIKLLLIRPVRRWKILLSKYVATLLYSVFGLVILFLTAMIVGGIAFGTDGFSIPYLYVENGAVHERSMFVHGLITYGYSCISLLIMVTFAFMISSAFRSSSMAIGISIGLMFMGGIVVEVLQKYEWIKYFLFSNLDLQQYSSGRSPVVEGMTLGFSITMLILYYFVFNLVAWLLFTKRDVAA